MRKVEVGLRGVAVPANAWAWLSNARDKVAFFYLPVVAVLLWGLIVVALNLARLDSPKTHNARPAPLRAEFAHDVQAGSRHGAKSAASPQVLKPDIVLPDIFIPVPADMATPAQDYFHAPAAQNGTFKPAQR